MFEDIVALLRLLSILFTLLLRIDSECLPVKHGSAATGTFANKDDVTADRLGFGMLVSNFIYYQKGRLLSNLV